MKHEETEAPRVGEVLVVQPGEAPSYWQPVPANGFIEVLVAPDRVAMEHPIGLGTQTVPPGCHVREHSHDRNEEVIYVLRGRGNGAGVASPSARGRPIARKKSSRPFGTSSQTKAMSSSPSLISMWRRFLPKKSAEPGTIGTSTPSTTALPRPRST